MRLCLKEKRKKKITDEWFCLCYIFIYVWCKSLITRHYEISSIYFHFLLLWILEHCITVKSMLFFPFSIQNEFIFFFCSVLKRDRSENLPGWMGYVLCQMVTSPGSYFLQAETESCRWYVYKKTDWAWGRNISPCSPVGFVCWQTIMEHGLRDNGW